MDVARIGFAPIKGSRHRSHSSVRLTTGGPVGDRAFCLIDPQVDRCLRTIDHPALLSTRASWDGTALSVALPSGDVVAAPSTTGDRRAVDYWGRRVTVEVVDGPWAEAFTAHLGRPVLLAAASPGDVVYGGAVTIVTSASLQQLAAEVGVPVEAARFRATFQLEGDVRPFDEAGWIGRSLRLGGAVVRVRHLVPRCRVIDLHPATGVRDLDLVPALARLHGQGATFGVDAEVLVPGEVTTGDVASLAPD